MGFLLQPSSVLSILLLIIATIVSFYLLWDRIDQHNSLGDYAVNRFDTTIRNANDRIGAVNQRITILRSEFESHILSLKPVEPYIIQPLTDDDEDFEFSVKSNPVEDSLTDVVFDKTPVDPVDTGENKEETVSKLHEALVKQQKIDDISDGYTASVKENVAKFGKYETSFERFGPKSEAFIADVAMFDKYIAGLAKIDDDVELSG